MSVSKTSSSSASRPRPSTSGTSSAKKTSTTQSKAPASKNTGATASKTPKTTTTRPTDSASVSKEAQGSKATGKGHQDHLKALEKNFSTESTKAADDKAPNTSSTEGKATGEAKATDGKASNTPSTEDKATGEAKATDGKASNTPSTEDKATGEAKATDGKKDKSADEKSAGENAASSALGKAADVTSKTALGGKAVTDVAGVAADKLTDGGGKLPRGLGVASPALGLVTSTAALPGQVGKASESISKAFETGKGDDIRAAVGDTAGATSTALTAAKSPLELAKGVHDFKTKGAAADALTKALPGASPEVRKAAIDAAAKESLKDVGAKDARRAVTKAASDAAKETSTLAKGAGATSRGAAKAALREGGEAAAKAATQAVAKGALKTTAKAAGRFVPGVNVAIAAADTAAAWSTINDPKASTGKKITSGITAVGSVIAATNVPGFSQAGAAISTVSSFIGSFF